MNDGVKRLPALLLIFAAAGLQQACVDTDTVIQRPVVGDVVGQVTNIAAQSVINHLDAHTQTQIVQSFLRGYGYRGDIDGVIGGGTQTAWANAQSRIPVLQGVSLQAANGALNVNIFPALQNANLLDGAVQAALDYGVQMPSLQSTAGQTWSGVREDAGRAWDATGGRLWNWGKDQFTPSR